jgi:hypothetical protein
VDDAKPFSQGHGDMDRSSLWEGLGAGGGRAGVDVVGISQTLGLLGAIGGGLVARNRKKEMEELNEKLRSVNAVRMNTARRSRPPHLLRLCGVERQRVQRPSSAYGVHHAPRVRGLQVLRQQARAGVTVAPGLSYVPGIEANYDEQPSAQDAASDAEVVRATLKEGKRMLREEPPRSGAAMVQFKKALMLARKDENLKVQERCEHLSVSLCLSRIHPPNCHHQVSKRTLSREGHEPACKTDVRILSCVHDAA